jgi:hypothetical protein
VGQLDSTAVHEPHRGREMRATDSDAISHHCDIQPMDLPTANTTVNMLSGMPGARVLHHTR